MRPNDEVSAVLIEARFVRSIYISSIQTHWVAFTTIHHANPNLEGVRDSVVNEWTQTSVSEVKPTKTTKLCGLTVGRKKIKGVGLIILSSYER
jgi:hypothetical protein